MKETVQILENEFSRMRTFKGFSIDRLSQMTPVLDNSLFSQKTTFKNDKMRSHECLYFLIRNTVNQTFFVLIFFTRGLRHPQ